MGSHSVTCHPTEVILPTLPLAFTSTHFTVPRRVEGWVDLGTAGKVLQPVPKTGGGLSHRSQVRPRTNEYVCTISRGLIKCNFYAVAKYFFCKLAQYCWTYNLRFPQAVVFCFAHWAMWAFNWLSREQCWNWHTQVSLESFQLVARSPSR